MDHPTLSLNIPLKRFLQGPLSIRLSSARVQCDSPEAHQPVEQSIEALLDAFQLQVEVSSGAGSHNIMLSVHSMGSTNVYPHGSSGGFSSSSSHCSDLQPHGYQHSQGLDFGPILDTSYGFHPVPSSASDMHPPHSNDLDFMSWLQNDSPAGPVIPEPPEQIMCRIMDDVLALEGHSVQSLVIFAHTTLPDFTRIHAPPPISQFLRSDFGLDAGQFVAKLQDSLSLSMNPDDLLASVRKDQKAQIKLARDRIVDGLFSILRSSGLKETELPKGMNYQCYNTKIVEEYHVELFGFPEPQIKNPGDLNAPILRDLLSRLLSGKCGWRFTTPEHTHIGV